MEYLICTVPVMPLRAEPSERSEMISQLLFGEAVLLLEKGEKGWIYIRNQFDEYEGWASLNQMNFISKELYDTPTDYYTSNLTTKVLVDGYPMLLPIGSSLKGIREGKMQWGNKVITYRGIFAKPGFGRHPGYKIKGWANKFLNTPYLWGGRSNYGIDCSGFVQTVFRLIGVKLPRDASQQAGCGELRPVNAALQCGDLAFFYNDKNKITHTGILLNNKDIIHASGKVRIDKLDATGIINVDTGKYSHKLASIRRII